MFYNGNLKEKRYSDFLISLTMMLEEVPLIVRQNLFFQKDRVPPHKAITDR